MLAPGIPNKYAFQPVTRRRNDEEATITFIDRPWEWSITSDMLDFEKEEDLPVRCVLGMDLWPLFLPRLQSAFCPLAVRLPIRVTKWLNTNLKISLTNSLLAVTGDQRRLRERPQRLSQMASFVIRFCRFGIKCSLQFTFNLIKEQKFRQA